ncbi:MAG: sulfatase [bacterium]|nr:sulfatase [bacterium]
MNRRILSLLFLLASALSAAAQRPNVVLFVTDDQGDVAGCYGHPDARTPHLDALARDGVRFANAFCTTASCSPSRAVLLSGEHSHSNGMYGLQHASHHFQSFVEVESLPVIFAVNGYRTARAGKFHVAPENTFLFEDALEAQPRNPAHMAKACADWIGGLEGAPFFLYFSTADPHRGGGVATELPGRPNRFSNREYDRVPRVRFDAAELTVPAWLPDTPETRGELAQFLESTARADHGIRTLVRALRKAGVWDNTILLVVSDHGPPFPGAKTTLYEPGMRVACVMRDPRVEERGVVREEAVSLLDVAPTLLEACGIAPGRRMQGRSFLPLVKASVEGWPDQIFASHSFHEVTMYYPMRAVRTSRYKLIWNIAHPLDFPFATDLYYSSTWQATLRAGADAPYGVRSARAYVQRPKFELYDLRDDPLESHNLAGDPKHAQALASLQGALRTFMDETEDPWRVKWERE